MPPFITSTQQPITTTRELGKGGEGSVYEVAGHSDQVAKIYHMTHRTPEKEYKLRAMIGNPHQDDTRHLSPSHISNAWPTEFLYEQKQFFVGYLMVSVTFAQSVQEV